MPPTVLARDTERPRRRREDTNRNLTTAEERRHLVRVIAANPSYLDWLRDHNARLLGDEASRAAEAGDTALAAALRGRASAHAAGEVDPW